MQKKTDKNKLITKTGNTQKRQSAEKEKNAKCAMCTPPPRFNYSKNAKMRGDIKSTLQLDGEDIVHWLTKRLVKCTICNEKSAIFQRFWPGILPFRPSTEWKNLLAFCWQEEGSDPAPPTTHGTNPRPQNPPTLPPHPRSPS